MKAGCVMTFLNDHSDILFYSALLQTFSDIYMDTS